MKKVFISQPMRGKTDRQIKAERKAIIKIAKEKFGEDVEILDSYFEGFNGNALAFLAKAIEVLSSADVAVFGKGWENARGCAIEHQCCVSYGIDTIDIASVTFELDNKCSVTATGGSIGGFTLN